MNKVCISCLQTLDSANYYLLDNLNELVEENQSNSQTKSFHKSCYLKFLLDKTNRYIELSKNKLLDEQQLKLSNFEKTILIEHCKTIVSPNTFSNKLFQNSNLISSIIKTSNYFQKVNDTFKNSINVAEPKFFSKSSFDNEFIEPDDSGESIVYKPTDMEDID